MFFLTVRTAFEEGQSINQQGQENSNYTTNNNVDHAKVSTQCVDINQVENWRCKSHQSLKRSNCCKHLIIMFVLKTKYILIVRTQRYLSNIWRSHYLSHFWSQWLCEQIIKQSTTKDCIEHVLVSWKAVNEALESSTDCGQDSYGHVMELKPFH